MTYRQALAYKAYELGDWFVERSHLLEEVRDGAEV